MAKRKYTQDEIIEGLMQVFRSVGYEGARLEELAKASGLKKSSLYHRFPGGKKQMADEVLKYAANWVKHNITDVLKREGDAKARLKRALTSFDLLYSGGEKACILRALSMESGLDLFATAINHSFKDIVEGFAKLAEDCGHTKKKALLIGEDALIKIQGGLILSRGTNDSSLFKRILKDIQLMF